VALVRVTDLHTERQATVAATLVDGVRAQGEALRAGLASVMPLVALRAFAPTELDWLFNGVGAAWDPDSMHDRMQPPWDGYVWGGGWGD
jgi:hypothetical protein